MQKIKNFRSRLFKETPIYSLVFTRIIFGLLILWECYDQFASQVLEENFFEPKFHFKYYGFEWVAMLPGDGMRYLFLALAAFAVCITLGLFYRASILLFTIGFTYAFLVEQTAYLNHFYMIILFSTLLTFMPAHRYFSLDAHFNPEIKTEKISFWPVFLLRAQMEIILLLAGLVKVNHDWLVRLMPLKPWLAETQTFDWLHNLFIQEWFVTSAAYGVVALHLIGAPLLFFKRTRIYIFLAYCIFHLMNDHVFQISSFPWMSMALTAIFFEADWPKKIFKFFDKTAVKKKFSAPKIPAQKFIILLMALWIISQVLIPMRYLLYPGHVSWTAEGQRFSWRMKLNTMNGATFFHVTHPETNQGWEVNVMDYLTHSQYMVMQCQPDLILQFAHHLRDMWKIEKGYENIKVTSASYCGLNGRKMRPYTDPEVDLASIPRSLKHNNWIKPFDPTWQ